MNAHELERYYPGDSSWKDFVDVHRERWDECTFSDALVSSLNGQEDIAQVVYSQIGEDAFGWIDRGIMALDGKSPRQCIAEGLVIRLRSMLMRM